MVHYNKEEEKEGPSDETMMKRENSEAEREISVKDGLSSPLPDPMDIVRITVGAVLPVNLKDLKTNYDRGSRLDFNPLGKRKETTDNNSLYQLKNLSYEGHPSIFSLDDTTSEMVHQSKSKKNSGEVFKCRYCLKVFRFSTGLHRHVNKYHSPTKPYACNICHKRFRSNFKVWTHCQTQHGVVQTPASSSYSSSGLDQTFEKVMEFAQKRQMKKALLWKQKMNKQSFQAPVLVKERLSPRYIHPCGKAFVFQSQHMWKYPAEKVDQDTANEGNLHQGQQHTGVDSCRLWNVKLSSLFEQSRRHTTEHPSSSLRFSSPSVKRGLETQCMKLSCLECNRTFKSSFSIWRHRVEVHNHNMLTGGNQVHLNEQEKASATLKEELYSDEHQATGSSREIRNSDSSSPLTYHSEDSWSFVSEDLGHYGKLVVKEEPLEEPMSQSERN